MALAGRGIVGLVWAWAGPAGPRRAGRRRRRRRQRRDRALGLRRGAADRGAVRRPRRHRLRRLPRGRLRGPERRLERQLRRIPVLGRGHAHARRHAPLGARRPVDRGAPQTDPRQRGPLLRPEALRARADRDRGNPPAEPAPAPDARDPRLVDGCPLPSGRRQQPGRRRLLRRLQDRGRMDARGRRRDRARGPRGGDHRAGAVHAAHGGGHHDRSARRAQLPQRGAARPPRRGALHPRRLHDLRRPRAAAAARRRRAPFATPGQRPAGGRGR